MSILFKDHNEDCEKLLYLIKYLESEMDIDIRPTYIVENQFPDYIEEILPSLLVKKAVYKGLTAIVAYFETELNLLHLLAKSEKIRLQ